MTSLIPLIQQMMIGNMVGKTTIPPLSFIPMGLRLMSCILLLAGIFLIIYAEYIWLGTFLPLHLSILLTSFTTIILSVIIGFMSRIFKHPKSTAPDSLPLDITALLTTILSSFDEDLEGAIKNNPKIAVTLSTLGGYMTGRKLNP